MSRNLTPPHELATLSVKGNAPNLGVRTVRIFVPTNMPTAPRHTLEWELIGHPTPPALLTEAPVLNTGLLKSGATLNGQTFVFEVLESRTTEPHVTKVVGSSIAGLVTGGVISERSAPTNDAVIRVYEYKLADGEVLKPGPIHADLKVYAVGSMTVPRFTVPIRGFAQENVRAVPESLSFDRSRVDADRTMKLIVISSTSALQPVVRDIKHPSALKVTEVARQADRIFFDVTLVKPEDLQNASRITLVLDRPDTRLDIPVKIHH